jgi:hypothetical protein
MSTGSQAESGDPKRCSAPYAAAASRPAAISPFWQPAKKIVLAIRQHAILAVDL